MELIGQYNSQGRVTSLKSLVHIEQEKMWALESTSTIWRREESTDNTGKRKRDIIKNSVVGDYNIKKGKSDIS